MLSRLFLLPYCVVTSDRSKYLNPTRLPDALKTTKRVRSSSGKFIFPCGTCNDSPTLAGPSSPSEYSDCFLVKFDHPTVESSTPEDPFHGPPTQPHEPRTRSRPPKPHHHHLNYRLHRQHRRIFQLRTWAVLTAQDHFQPINLQYHTMLSTQGPQQLSRWHLW